MKTKSELIVNYWLENKERILSLAIAAKLFGGGDHASNRRKIKPHILKAKRSIEKDRGVYIYSIWGNGKLLGYRIAAHEEKLRIFRK